MQTSSTMASILCISQSTKLTCAARVRPPKVTHLILFDALIQPSRAWIVLTKPVREAILQMLSVLFVKRIYLVLIIELLDPLGLSIRLFLHISFCMMIREGVEMKEVRLKIKLPWAFLAAKAWRSQPSLRMHTIFLTNS